MLPETETKEILSIANLEKLFANQKDDVAKAVDAKLADWGKGFKAASQEAVDKIIPAAKEEKETEEEAALEDSKVSTSISKITDFQVAGVPIGGAVVGGFAAIFATELVDGYLKNQSTMVRGLVKLAAAGVVIKFGKKYLGSSLCNTFALLVAFDGLKNDIMPGIFNYATTWANKLTGTVTVAGLGHTGGNVIIPATKNQVKFHAYQSSGLIQ